MSREHYTTDRTHDVTNVRSKQCKVSVPEHARQSCWTWLDGGGIEGGSRDGGGGSDKGAAGKQSLLAHGASRKPFIACVVVDTRREGGMPAR